MDTQEQRQPTMEDLMKMMTSAELQQFKNMNTLEQRRMMQIMMTRYMNQSREPQTHVPPAGMTPVEAETT